MPNQVSEMQNLPLSRTLWKSVWAVFAGILVNVVPALGTDQLLHWLYVYPPWGEPMNEPGDNVLALSYRIVFGILGSYVTAKTAPHSPMRHAMILGWFGLVISAAGVIVATMSDLGPIWYPIALVVVALPCAWLGGYLCEKSKSSPH